MIPYIDEIIKPPNYIDELVQRTFREVEQKKEELIKMKLREKGFSRYADNLLTARFPKVCCHKSNGWSLYYADDGTDNGAFIIAISDFQLDMTCEVNVVRVFFNWSDKLPLPKTDQKRR